MYYRTNELQCELQRAKTYIQGISFSVPLPKASQSSSRALILLKDLRIHLVMYGYGSSDCTRRK